MSTCRNCGEEITFRYIEGRCVPLHPYGSPCGERLPYSGDSLKRSVHTRCPQCQKMVFLVHHNGGKVWLDELGWPWPKHGCFDSDADHSGGSVGRASRSTSIASFSSLRSTSGNGRRFCGSCGRTMDENEYDRHLSRCRNWANAARASEVMRQCEYCKVPVKEANYARHVRNVHGVKKPGVFAVSSSHGDSGMPTQSIKPAGPSKSVGAAPSPVASPSASFRITEKGALAVHGMGRFPVTLYREQWLKLLAESVEIRAFISKNDKVLKRKSPEV